MNRTLNYHLPLALAFFVIAWFALVQPLSLIVWLFNIITWGVFILMAPLVLVPKHRKLAIYRSYREGKHAPEWFDVIHYGTLACMCAAFGHPFKAAAWIILMTIDLKHRHDSEYE